MYGVVCVCLCEKSASDAVVAHFQEPWQNSTGTTDEKSRNPPRGRLAAQDTHPGLAEHKAAGLTFEQTILFFLLLSMSHRSFNLQVVNGTGGNDLFQSLIQQQKIGNKVGLIFSLVLGGLRGAFKF